MLRLADQATRLTTDVAGLLAGEEGPYHSYLGDTGPAVRANFFERGLDSDRHRMDAQEGEIHNLEATFAFMTETLEVQEVNLQKQAEEVQSLTSDLDATSNRASTQPDRKGENRMVTERKGLDRLKPYSGEAAQWKDWRFKITTWLSQVKPSFETRTTKLGKSTSEPEEPEPEGKVKIGPDEITT